ncbi:MAG: hypothetical protein TREMPRED_000694 [Tremellales sp. Tagirdzhanova-0007]|nr:MAG: hypothetical protein TREMPRED_000694 [Tremellales sp. Tagirdzhanova-0007]
MPLISIFVTSPDTHSERRFDSSLTVKELKVKLTPITGIQPQHQLLRLHRSAEAVDAIATLADESRTLEGYGVEEWNCVDNTDPSARPGEFTDLSAVDKFDLTAEEYEARNDTVLAHLKAAKLGRFASNPTSLTLPHPIPPTVPSQFILGARCEVVSGEGAMPRRGAIRYVGEATFGRGGVWIGIELDEPVGKGDGSIEGRRYFSCSALHAVFVRYEKVKIGDFPEEDFMEDDNDDI